MKKFNHANIGLFALFTALLCLSSCNSDDDNYPKEYVGFEHSITKVNCDKNEAEKEIQIKIIAVKKSKEDRTVALSTFFSFLRHISQHLHPPPYRRDKYHS